MKIALFVLIGILPGISGLCQRLSAADVPPQVVTAFGKLQPDNKKHVWMREGRHQYAVEYASYGITQTTLFDSTGVVVRTRSEILAEEDLPKFVQDSLRRYSAMDFVRAIKTETPGGCIVFEVDIAQNRTIATRRFSQGCPRVPARKVRTVKK